MVSSFVFADFNLGAVLGETWSIIIMLLHSSLKFISQVVSGHAFLFLPVAVFTGFGLAI